ncbi:hypothetical protein F5B21DRAFT_521147 [Xylaria acuta]|nr:hypothetical protein F5B21DRAFT_521147 [Xylaria acuta]
MEEHGETPRWRGEMRFTFRDGVLGDFLDLKNQGEWIDFPSGQDIKWFWVGTPSGRTWLRGGQNAQHWGPFRRAESCTPFVMVDGRIVRDCGPVGAGSMTLWNPDVVRMAGRGDRREMPVVGGLVS